MSDDMLVTAAERKRIAEVIAKLMEKNDALRARVAELEAAVKESLTTGEQSSAKPVSDAYKSEAQARLAEVSPASPPSLSC